MSLSLLIVVVGGKEKDKGNFTGRERSSGGLCGKRKLFVISSCRAFSIYLFSFTFNFSFTFTLVFLALASFSFHFSNEVGDYPKKKRNKEEKITITILRRENRLLPFHPLCLST